MKPSNRTKSFSDVAHIHSGKSVFAARGWKRTLLKFRHASWKPVVLGAVSVVIIGGILFWSKIGRSQTAAFYPVSCLGGWEHPENAAGKPDVSQGVSSPDVFTEQNSAVLRNVASQIYCGNFQGDIPDNAEPLRATIRFSMTFKPDVPATPGASTTPVFNAEFPLLTPAASTTASSSELVLPAPTPEASMVRVPDQSTTSVIFVSPDASVSPTTIASGTEPLFSVSPQPAASPITEPSPAQPSPAPAPSPLPSMPMQPSPAASSSPIVWLMHALFRDAFALETASSTSASSASPLPTTIADLTPSPEPSPMPSAPTASDAASSTPLVVATPSAEPIVSVSEISVPAPIPEETLTAQASSSATITPEVTPSPSELAVSANPSPEIASSTGALWEVLYTTDGKTWNHVAYLGQGDWNQAFLDLPSFSWNDLTTLQVSIQSLATGEIVPAVYLDSIWIQVDYVAVSPSPTVSVRPSVTPYPGNLVLGDTKAGNTRTIMITGVQPGAAVELYRLDDPDTAANPDPDSRPTNVYALTVGDNGQIAIDVSTLDPGIYVAVGTRDSEQCNGLYLAQCRADDTYLGEVSFSIP